MSATRRRLWAKAMMCRAGTNCPVYGSPEWSSLPEGSAAKVAAVVRAAECWAREGDELEDRLRLQLAAERRAFKRTEDAAYQDRAQEHWAENRERVRADRRCRRARTARLETYGPGYGEAS